MNSEMLSHFSIDVFDLCCPSALQKAKAILYRLSSGQTLAVSRVHFLQITDFEEWCQRTGQFLQSKNQISSDYFDIVIKKV